VSITKYSSANVLQWTLSYEYDGLDRRTRRTFRNAAGTVTVQQRFLYETNALSSLLPLGGEGARRADEGANWEPVIVLDERLAGEPYQKVDHRYMNGPAIDQVFADETGGNGVLWYLSDTQNTVRDVAKYASTTAGTQATVRNHLEYNTFGIVTTADDPTTATVNDGDRPGLEGTGNEFSPQRSYTGREPDTATGLIYYRARWFDPRIGRFISEDPIGFAAGDTNLSRYVGNSTPNAVDPSGLEEKAITKPGEDFRLFYVFAFEADKAKYAVRFTGANGPPSAAQAAASGITPSGSPNMSLHPIEHCLNQHAGGPTPYTSASGLPKGAAGFAGEPVWIDLNKLKGNEVYKFDEIMKMSKEFLERNPHLKQRFEMWKKAQALEGELLIKGKIASTAVSSKGAMRLKTVVRVSGKSLLLAAVAMDTCAFFEAENRSQAAARIAGGWVGAYAGGKLGAVAGAKAGAGVATVAGFAGPQAATPEEVVTVPVGAGVGGILGGIAGSIGGYWAGSQAGRNYYDFIQSELERLKQ